MSARHHSERRWPVLALVVAVLAGVGAFAATRGTPAPAAASVGPAALVGATDAESSVWYCTGQSTASGGGGAVGGPVLTNTSAKTRDATIAAVSETGASAHRALSVPAHSVAAPSLPALSSGSWQAETVTVAGGGVAVSQTVHGPAGWSQAPCVSSTASRWFFPGGTTKGADGLYLSLLNPTSTPVVVDLTFITPTGAVHPVNYQGIVLQPGQVQVEDVSSEVQDSSDVSTVVATRTGRIAAALVQLFAGSSPGLALVSGATTPQHEWVIPQAQEITGGTSAIDVFNPGTGPEAVRVSLRLPSGPLAPLTSTVAPGTMWSLESSAQTRIPRGETYSAEIVATGGGAGVVVGRRLELPASANSPQAGMTLAVDGLTMAAPSREWVVPPAGTQGAPAVGGAAPAALALTNASGNKAHYTAFAESGSSTRVVARGDLAAHETFVVSGAPLAGAGLDQIVVRADAPLAISEDWRPSGGVGVVSMPGIALAAPIGL